eukprot:TRINITY_DN74752_c0_g1_i1.p1 TRINITY_DN74752_c0_g1~~TRINITY_DN74752_c0_g1_i1.p1  ORF type:complete len:274 (+),score=37.69 TRINITY_DN74752_c0_g1_i1:68-889(+)
MAGTGATASAVVRPTLEFFSAWFCPYAQRAWIALEHHGLPYQRHEALKPDKPGEDFVGYIKLPRLLELNPKGLVPTLSEGEGTPPVYESAICVEYIDELALRSAANGDGAAFGSASLLPGGPCERAQLRMRADWVNRQCCSPFYQVLVRKDAEERAAAFDTLSKSFDELEESIVSPYLAGDSLSLVDLMFIPWAHRIMICKVIERFRGPAFAFDLAQRPKLARWTELVFGLPAVKATLADPEALIATYKRYADGVAQSKVAEAVRQGKSADTV